MADYINDSYYQLSLNILKALGGDTSVVYPDADAIWEEIYKIYDHAGGRYDIVPLQTTITENGQYDYYPDADADAFVPVNIKVDVPQKYTDEQVENLTETARKNGFNDGVTVGFTDGRLVGQEEGFTQGYTEGETIGMAVQKQKLTTIEITENGEYVREDGYSVVTVAVEGGISDEELEAIRTESYNEGFIAGEADGYNDGYAEGVDDGFIDGAADQKAKLTTLSVTDNGTYTREDGWNSVTVEVAGSGDSGKPKIYNGFVLIPDSDYSKSLPTGALSNIDFSQYDWSKMYDLSYFFAYFRGTAWQDSDFESFKNHYNGSILSCARLFERATNQPGVLTKIPDAFNGKMDNALSLSEMFYNQNKLTDVSNLAYWNTSNVVDTSSMFYQCTILPSVPWFNTSNVVDMKQMFYAASTIPDVPLFDTHNVIDMNKMFYMCNALTTIPEFDMTNVVDTSEMFNNCTKLESVPDLNTTSLRKFSSSSSGMFNNCTKLISIGVIDCGSIDTFFALFGSQCNSITSFGGFKDLGKVPEIANTTSNNQLNYMPNLDHDSLLNVVNLLYDRATAGYSVLTLKMHANHLALLTDEEKAIATNKGWALS